VLDVTPVLQPLGAAALLGLPPIVDHRVARERALEAFATMTAYGTPSSRGAAIRAVTRVFDAPPARSRASSTRHQRVHARLRRATSAFTRVFDALWR